MRAPAAPGTPLVIGVLPDLTGLDRIFHYLVPPALADRVELGTLVAVRLQGRRLRAWVVDVLVEDQERDLLEIEEVVSFGPDRSVLELGRFGAKRYAGRLRPFLLASSPPRPVVALGRGSTGASLQPPATAIAEATSRAIDARHAVLRLPPAAARLEVVETAAALVGAGLLVLVPEVREVEILAERLRRSGHAVATWPSQWASAAGGSGVVVGARNAVFARMERLSGLVVLDAHAEAYRSERAPTWRVPELAVERARQGGAPCVLVSPCPGLSDLALGELVTVGRGTERAGWPPLEIFDRRGDDPRSGLYSERLAPLIRGALERDQHRPVVGVLNRKGRARLLACGACGSLARCEACGAALRQREAPSPGEAGVLTCPACGLSRPLVCASCSSARIKLLRIGVARAAEELAALVGEEVQEVSGRPSRTGDASPARVLVGTEAVLHRTRSASLVVFLDVDQELMAPRYRAGEQALALLARAARLVGGRAGGSVAVQTRLPDHEVLSAALHGDPGRLTDAEAPRRRALRLPPFAALALVSGEEAATFAAGLPEGASGIERVRLDEDRFLLRAADSEVLAERLAAGGAPRPGVRIEVDPNSV